jgi:filamentous hemagglutinin family protein
MGSHKSLQIKFVVQVRLLFLALSILLFSSLRVSAQTQINPDGTLPTTVTNNGGVFEITGGGKVGNGANLFHSFKDFSIQSGDTARFVYNSGVTNIITRVTGGVASQINGTISTLNTSNLIPGNANLYFINPSGIIFGANAKLNIGGAFVASTASAIKFADGVEFSAVKPTPNPLLTVSVPFGLQFNNNSNSNIRVDGTGNNLILNQDFSLVRQFKPSGLSSQPQGQIALIGGNVSLDGGNISSPQGNIDLWSVNQGIVEITNLAGKVQLKPGNDIRYGNIELKNAASIDTSGNSAGNIQVQGANININNGSVIISDTLGNGTGGELTVNASESLRLQGAIFNPPRNIIIFSSILGDVDKNASGTGSNIHINTKVLQLDNGAQISTGTFGSGNAGRLNVNATDIQINGFFSPLGPSGLFAPVAPGATGKGGNLAINTQNLRITNGAQIYTNTYSTGQAGDLQIKAENIEVIGGTQFGPSNISTSVFYRTQNNSSTDTSLAKGGNLNINTSSLRVSDGAQISVGTAGDGNAGNLVIAANSVELSGSNQFGRSGLFASAIGGRGNGGDILLNTDTLTIQDGATISVSNFPSRAGRTPPGTGAAGNIEINAQNILLKNQATVTADTNAGDKGNTLIRTDSLLLKDTSLISTNARNSSNGGNINITTNTLLAFYNSDITANAQQGFGGRVTINVQAIFGTKFRPLLTPQSDITATSEAGAFFKGIVEFNTPDLDPTQSLVNLPDDVNLAFQPIVSACTASSRQNSFTVIGRGGIPINPTNTLVSATTWNDMRDVSGRRNKKKYINVSHQPELIEAQALSVDASGEINLIASNAVLTPQPKYQHYQCY